MKLFHANVVKIIKVSGVVVFCCMALYWFTLSMSSSNSTRIQLNDGKGRIVIELSEPAGYKNTVDSLIHKGWFDALDLEDVSCVARAVQIMNSEMKGLFKMDMVEDVRPHLWFNQFHHSLAEYMIVGEQRNIRIVCY